MHQDQCNAQLALEVEVRARGTRVPMGTAPKWSQSTAINSNQQQSTAINSNQQTAMSTLPYHEKDKNDTVAIQRRCAATGRRMGGVVAGGDVQDLGEVSDRPGDKNDAVAIQRRCAVGWSSRGVSE